MCGHVMTAWPCAVRLLLELAFLVAATGYGTCAALPVVLLMPPSHILNMLHEEIEDNALESHMQARWALLLYYNYNKPRGYNAHGIRTAPYCIARRTGVLITTQDTGTSTARASCHVLLT